MQCNTTVSQCTYTESYPQLKIAQFSLLGTHFLLSVIIILFKYLILLLLLLSLFSVGKSYKFIYYSMLR